MEMLKNWVWKKSDFYGSWQFCILLRKLNNLVKSLIDSIPLKGHSVTSRAPQIFSRHHNYAYRIFNRVSKFPKISKIPFLVSRQSRSPLCKKYTLDSINIEKNKNQDFCAFVM